jgi:hypothetical protein
MYKHPWKPAVRYNLTSIDTSDSMEESVTSEVFDDYYFNRSVQSKGSNSTSSSQIWWCARNVSCSMFDCKEADDDISIDDSMMTRVASIASS